jgi:type I restriction enzyme S subunit
MASVGRADIVTSRFEGAINPTYFILYVRGSRTVFNYIKEVNHGATRDGINTSQLLGLPVALPPLAEQRRIVAEVERRLSVVQEVEAVIAANLARAERLRQSILKRAFEGKLVAQDPNDEPASALLERIRAQRQGQAAKRETHRREARGAV